MTPDIDRATESLEVELKEVSERIAADPLRFQQIRDELARRHAAKDDQPTPDPKPEDPTADKDACELAGRFLRTQSALTNKIIAMEMQQAELVVEAEIAKAGRIEAERRLTLISENVSKMLAAATKRVPLTRDEAKLIGLAHKHKHGTATGTVDDWVVDAIIGASAGELRAQAAPAPTIHGYIGDPPPVVLDVDRLDEIVHNLTSRGDTVEGVTAAEVTAMVHEIAERRGVRLRRS